MLGLAIFTVALVAFLGGLEQGSPGVLVDVITASAHISRAVSQDYMGQLQLIANGV